MRPSDPRLELMLACERADSLRRSYAAGPLFPFRLSDLRRLAPSPRRRRVAAAAPAPKPV